MKRLILQLAALCSICLFTSSAYAAIVVEYEVFVKQPISEEKMEAVPDNVFISIMSSGHIILRGVWGWGTNSYQLYDLSAERQYVCPDNGDIADRMPFEPTEQIVYYDDSPVIIAGLPCRRAGAVIDRDTFDVFYTEAFGVDFCQIARVPGFAMQYTKLLRGVEVTYRAVRFSFADVPAEMTDLSKYKIVDYVPGVEFRIINEDLATIPSDFTLTTLTGATFDVSSLSGKVTVLSFWGTNCVPCRREIPSLNRLVKKFARQPDVAFFAVSSEPGKVVEDFLQHTPFHYQMTYAGSRAIADLAVQGFPTHIVINRRGQIVRKSIGPSVYTHSILRDAVKKALKAQ